MQESQAQNGTESILEEIEQIKAYDRAKTATDKETGIAGDAKVAQNLIFENTFAFVIQHPTDTLFMVFNFNAVNAEFISTCLRDEIWSLEALRDVVGAEMVKAYMLRDHFHGGLLMDDYRYLVTHLELLRKYGSNPTAKFRATDRATKKPVQVNSTKYFFGNKDTTNYYRSNFSLISNEPGCPDNEFEEAFKQVAKSAKTLAVLSSGQGVEWGDIWKMAKANARIRAKEWIQANQMTLTVGGEEGGRVESLIKGGGPDKFVGQWKTEWEVLKNMVGPVTPWFDSSIYKPLPNIGKIEEGVGTDCAFYDHEDGNYWDCYEEQLEWYEKCQDDEEAARNEENIPCERFYNTEEFISAVNKSNRREALKQEHDQEMEDAENAFKYSVSFDSVAEQNIYLMDEILFEMNSNIERGYEAVHKEAGEGIPTLLREIEKLTALHCANKKK